MLFRVNNTDCIPSSRVILENISHYQQIWVRCNLSYSERLNFFNKVVALNGEKMMKFKRSVEWPKRPVSLVYFDSSNHLQMTQVENSTSFITTIFLEYVGPQLNSSWSFHDPLIRNSFVDSKFFDWKGMYPVCEWVRRYVKHSGSNPCDNSSLSINSAQVSLTSFNMKLNYLHIDVFTI